MQSAQRVQVRRWSVPGQVQVVSPDSQEREVSYLLGWLMWILKCFQVIFAVDKQACVGSNHSFDNHDYSKEFCRQSTTLSLNGHRNCKVCLQRKENNNNNGSLLNVNQDSLYFNNTKSIRPVMCFFFME